MSDQNGTRKAALRGHHRDMLIHSLRRIRYLASREGQADIMEREDYDRCQAAVHAVAGIRHQVGEVVHHLEELEVVDGWGPDPAAEETAEEEAAHV